MHLLTNYIPVLLSGLDLGSVQCPLEAEVCHCMWVECGGGSLCEAKPEHSDTLISPGLCHKLVTHAHNQTHNHSPC